MKTHALDHAARHGCHGRKGTYGPPPPPPDREATLTLTREIAPIGDGIVALDIEKRAQPITYAFDVTGLSVTQGALLHEEGASGSGLYFGRDSAGTYGTRKWIFRFGSGDVRWNANTWWGVFDGDVIQGDGTLVYCVDVDTVNSRRFGRVFWNNVQMFPEQGSGDIGVGQWAGTNVGSFAATSTNAVSDENWTVAGYTTISNLRVYENQTPP